MYTKKMIDDAIEHFSKNSYWKEEYETAPSDTCRERIAIDYCYSLYGNGYDDDSERDRLEAQLSLADWKHLLKYSGNNPWRGKCRQKIRELEEAGQA